MEESTAGCTFGGWRGREVVLGKTLILGSLHEFFNCIHNIDTQGLMPVYWVE